MYFQGPCLYHCYKKPNIIMILIIVLIGICIGLFISKYNKKICTNHKNINHKKKS